MHTQATLVLRVYTLPNAGRLLHSCYTTHPFSSPAATSLATLRVYEVGCVDDKQPWLHGWASLLRTPHV